MPPPSNAETTRERFAAHSTDKGCFACHETLGRARLHLRELRRHGRPARERTRAPLSSPNARAKLGGEELEFADSVGSGSSSPGAPVVSECFARHAFRYFSAEHDPAVEASFLSVRERPAAVRAATTCSKALIAYVRSDLVRRARGEVENEDPSPSFPGSARRDGRLARARFEPPRARRTPAEVRSALAPRTARRSASWASTRRTAALTSSGRRDRTSTSLTTTPSSRPSTIRGASARATARSCSCSTASISAPGSPSARPGTTGRA